MGKSLTFGNNFIPLIWLFPSGIRDQPWQVWNKWEFWSTGGGDGQGAGTFHIFPHKAGLSGRHGAAAANRGTEAGICVAGHFCPGEMAIWANHPLALIWFLLLTSNISNHWVSAYQMLLTGQKDKECLPPLFNQVACPRGLQIQPLDLQLIAYWLIVAINNCCLLSSLPPDACRDLWVASSRFG